MAIDPITGEVILTEADYKEHNIQALIELSYMRAANLTLEGNLSSLNSALNVTKDVMDTLAGLQNLHNKITVDGKGEFTAVTGYSYLNGTSASYQSAARDFFGSTVDPKVAFEYGTSAQIQFSADIALLKAKLSAQIPLLSGITPRLPSDQGGGEDPNSLLSKLRAVLQDLNNYDLSSYQGQADWVLDNYPSLTGSDSANAGLIQQRLTFAIAAGQSLNDVQKSTVRNILTVVEEYYKSASSIIQKISQIIEKMAQSISR